MSGIKLVEMIEVNYCLVQNVFNILALGGFDITSVIEDFAKRKYDSTKAKKVSLIMRLMLKSDKWVSKDAMLQAEVVGNIFYIYNKHKDEIKEQLMTICETLTEGTQDDLLDENTYLECMDNLKILHNMFDGLETLTRPPTGEWMTIDDEIILLMYY